MSRTEERRFRATDADHHDVVRGVILGREHHVSMVWLTCEHPGGAGPAHPVLAVGSVGYGTAHHREQ